MSILWAFYGTYSLSWLYNQLCKSFWIFIICNRPLFILLGHSSHFNTEKRYDNVVTLAAAAAAVIIIRRHRRRRLQHRRLLWCKPWLQAWDSDRGMSHFINYELKDDASSLFAFLRMPPEVFRELLAVVAPRITKSNTFMRDSICAEDMLTVTLRYLASGTITWINPS